MAYTTNTDMAKNNLSDFEWQIDALTELNELNGRSLNINKILNAADYLKANAYNLSTCFKNDEGIVKDFKIIIECKNNLINIHIDTNVEIDETKDEVISYDEKYGFFVDSDENETFKIS